jgi:hypothetical protein
VILVEVVDAVRKCEGETAWCMSCAVIVADVSCFGYEFAEWFNVRHRWHFGEAILL